MVVFIFYRTDQWNSYDSKSLVYVGTNKEASIKKLMRLDDDPITEEQADDLRRINQSQCNGLSYEWIIETWNVNSINV